MEVMQVAVADTKEEAYEIAFGSEGHPQEGLLARLRELKAIGAAGDAFTLEVTPTVRDGTVGGYWQVVLHRREEDATVAEDQEIPSSTG